MPIMRKLSFNTCIKFKEINVISEKRQIEMVGDSCFNHNQNHSQNLASSYLIKYSGLTNPKSWYIFLTPYVYTHTGDCIYLHVNKST